MHNATKLIRTAACVALGWLAPTCFLLAQNSPPVPNSQSARLLPLASGSPPSSRETEFQRWIPLDTTQGHPPNPFELLARLQKRNKPSSDPFSWQQLQKAFQDNPGLSDQLQNLSQSQREQLKQLAESFSQQAFPNGPPKSLDDLPPSLRQQMENSPELKMLAEEIARSAERTRPQREGQQRGETQGNGSPDAGSPEPSPEDLERQLQELLENRTGGANDQNAYRNSTTPYSDESTAGPSSKDSSPKSPSPNQRDASNGRPWNDDADAHSPQNASQNPDPSRRGNAPGTKGSTSDPQNETGLAANSKGTELDATSEEEWQRAELERIQKRWDEIQRQRALAEHRMQQRQQALSRNASRSTREAGLQPSSGASSESSVDMIRRKLRELGLSSFLQQIAKEAVGVEQKRLDPAQDPNRESDQVATPPTSKPSSSPSQRLASNPPKPSRSSDPNPVGQAFNDSNNRWGEGIPRSDKEDGSRLSWFTDSNSLAPRARSSASEPQQDDAPEKAAEESPFSLPSLGDLPSLPVWFWLVPLLFGLFLLTVYLIPRSRVMLDRITGRAAAEASRTEAQLGDIQGREDAVRAFHWILERKVRGFESWWTSRRVVEHVRHRKEPLQPQVAEAANLYDLARYTPETYRLDSNELERMRQAIRACASAETIG